MNEQREPRTLRIVDLLTVPFDRLEDPNGGTYWLARNRCECEEDDGIRWEGPMSFGTAQTCATCGEELAEENEEDERELKRIRDEFQKEVSATGEHTSI